MAKSASMGDERRRLTVERIVTTAQRLCLDRGFSGFTLDDLAEEVGVSRRTLFNYVPDKEHAVLGLGPELDPDEPRLARFRAGGPTGDLPADLGWALEGLVECEPHMAENLDRVGRLLKAHPELLPRFMKHMDEALGIAVGMILERPGETRERAAVATGMILTLLHVAARESVETGRPLREALAGARAALESLTSPAPRTHP